MNTIHVTLNTRGLSVAGLAVFGQSIVTQLTDNSNFSNLYPKLGTLQSAVGDLNAAIQLAKPGDKQSTVRVHLAEAELNRILKALAAHIEFESNNDEVKALSSGFGLRHPNQPATNTFEAVHGTHSGSVNLKSPHQTNASYVWQYTPDPMDEDEWTPAGVTVQATHTISGLKAGGKYWFRVAVVIKTGQQPFCDPVSLIVI